MAGGEVGRDGNEWTVEFLDGERMQVGMQDLSDTPAGDHSARAQLEVEEARHSPLGEPAGPLLELFHSAPCASTAHERADRRSADDIGPQPGSLEDVQYAKMSPAAADAAAKCNPDQGPFGPRHRRGFSMRRWCRRTRISIRRGRGEVGEQPR